MNNDNTDLLRDPLPLPGNFVSRSSVFLLDEITVENTRKLLSDLEQVIQYETMNKHTINWFINSPGGDVSACHSILTMMRIANMSGVMNQTIVIGYAASSASVIAIHGNLRKLSKDAYHFVHYGTIGIPSSHPKEVAKNYEFMKNFNSWMVKEYLENTKIPKDKLLDMIDHETGYIYPKEALKYKLCDEII